MRRAIDKWTTTAGIALVLGALLACKKKTDAPAPEASTGAVSIAGSALASASAAAVAASAAAAATPPAVVDAGVAAPPPVLGDVKRFPDKEKVATGAVKVTVDQSKVYDEPDDTKPSVASLSKDLFVVRQATLGTDWILVEFPSGVGKLSPGWIEAKSLGEQVQPAVTKATVAAQPAAATSASAKPATTVATAPTVTAAAAVTTPPPTPTVVPTVKKKPSLLSAPHH